MSSTEKLNVKMDGSHFKSRILYRLKYLLSGKTSLIYTKIWPGKKVLKNSKNRILKNCMINENMGEHAW